MLVRVWRGAFAAAALVCIASQAVADIPRTPEGRPDFQGIWSTRWVTPLEREPDMPLVIAEPEALALEKRVRGRYNAPLQFCFDIANWEGPMMQIKGGYRSSLVIDPPNGRIPYTAAGRAANAAFGARMNSTGSSDPEARVRTERCLGGVGQAPMQIRSSGMLHQFVQTPAHVVVLTEGYADLRIIPFGERTQPPAVLTDLNESVARWEGDALIVTTDGLNPASATRGLVTIMSPAAKVTERFEMLSADEILYRYTIVDPVNYTQPWTAEYTFVRTTDRMYEFTCHEYNYGLVNILNASRAGDRSAAKAAQRP